MTTAEEWDPLPVADVVALMQAFPERWWISGGHALELHVGRTWRRHDDVDIGLGRRDAPLLATVVPDREMFVAAAGRLSRWDGRELAPERHENNVWLRRPGGSWQVDVTVGDGDDDAWVFRRDPTLRLPWRRAVLHSPDGVPYLAPALQLLFKSKDVRPKDQLDAEEVIPVLDPGSLALLDVRLPGDHEWRTLVDSRLKGMSGGDVHAVVSWLSAAGVDVWIDGGWAVDALVAQHTRRHRDLDLALPTRSWAAARAALEDEGFVVVRDDGPFNVVVGDRHGRLVDLHAFDDSTTVSGDDGVAVHGPNGLPYLAEGMTATGTIDGRVVRCISAEHLMRYHSGYELDADDRHDIDLLHRSCGVPLL